MTPTVCDKCGDTIYEGAWPFCPHPPMAAKSHAVMRDEIPGGQVIENLGHEPMRFDSHSAIRAEADRRGLRLRDQWAGPHDKHLSNWAAGIDAYTLEAARTLLTRGSRAPETPSPGSLETLTTEIVEIKKWSDVR